MSSPIQPPPNIRSPSTAQVTSAPVISPYAHHLPPPPNLAHSNTLPRVTELPSILSPRSASPSTFHPTTALPPPSSLASPTVLPPPIPSRTSTPPFERRPSAPANVPPSSPQGGYRPLNVRDALTYLDQVKIRFSDQPDVYNRFLDIMKDFKSQAIDTPGVIERVSTLFKGHPTLISGFNTFLPPGYRIECSTDPREPDLITVTTPSGVTTTTGKRYHPEPHPIPPPPPPYYPYSHMHPPPLPSAMPQGMMSYRPSIPAPPPPHPQQPVQQTQPPPPQPVLPPQPLRRSPSVIDDEEEPLEFNHAINYVNRIKNRYAHDPDTYKQFLEILQTYQKDHRPIQEVYAHVQYLFNGATDLLEEFKQFLPDITGQSSLFDIAHGKRNGSSGSLPKRAKTEAFSFSNFDPSKPAVSSEEIELFERIRKHIGNKPSYEEFLKTLNLYTLQIINLDTLVEQVSIFIGNHRELFGWFKSMIGYEPKEHAIEKPSDTVLKPDLNTCQTTGTHESPSYRVVPKEWQNQPCSGRDQLCWEVLNDEYVSHPIWASEEDGFVASKKSQYEEAMHRCEEERYDYNMNIDANLNVIALLEPIDRRIERMTAEERNHFRLRPGLGGESVTIYERIIKKIYDKERGLEIIELLYSSPAQVVPILLKRLKQKDEEWKRAQREWNKVWREVDAKNFYRALDYQGITYKGNDRKVMAPKALVAEIEHSLHAKRRSKRDEQFKFDFKDQELFKDLTRIIYSFVDRQSGYTNSDRERIRLFIQTFIPLCFQVENVVSENDSQAMHYKQETVEEVEEEEMDEDMEDDRSTHTEESDTATKRTTVKEDDHVMDLLRDVLTKDQDAIETPTDDLLENENLLAAAAAVIAPGGIKKRSVYSFFCNTSFYCFFRLYQMLYERLEKLKNLGNEMERKPKLDVDVSKGYYLALLDLIDKFFEGEIDQNFFEEYTRYIFVTDAYLLFTIDKLVHTMIKQIQTVITDPKSVELIRLFKCDKGLESMSPRTLAVYRLRAEDIAGSSDHLYKINFDNESQCMTIQLIGKDDYMMEPTAEDEYEDYVASYMDWVNTTDGIDPSQMKSSFLRRNLRPQDEHLNRIFVRSKLQYKIDQSSYHMYYIVGSEDVFVRPYKKPIERKETRWQEWLSSPTTGWSRHLDPESRTRMEREANELFK
ncbi:Transcriptional regulatory protein sin3 [Rhizopus stolonifer]|uniref:Transcriptional regulatory protein sin3 n=1 Tax=Rhizopus stolonifer TaxID=4846 RepID=A0A367KUX9_RHIST|nr:Transcriptional regulatory protein sin3 [Rhizopus stolonifer]